MTAHSIPESPPAPPPAEEATPAQQFFSFLAAVGPEPGDDAFERALGALPRYADEAAVLEADGLRLALFAPAANPLYRQLVYSSGSQLLLLQGELYRDPPEAELRAAIAGGRLDMPALRAALARVNGAFNGFVVDRAAGVAVAFTDMFGFRFLYYTAWAGRTWISSSLWPLLRLRGQLALSPEAIEDVLLLGYPTGDLTIARDVYTLQPGRMARLGPAGREVEEYLPRQRHAPQTAAAAVERFRGVFRDHVAHVAGRVGRDRFAMTITGGHDTRVVLNALLLGGVTPTCLTGTGYPSLVTLDARRAMSVAAVAGCPRVMYNYTRGSDALKADAFFMSEGGGTGLWMASIAGEGSRYGDVMYYGFSGDVLSGSPEAVNPSLLSDLDGLARATLVSNYEYQQGFPEFCRDVLSRPADEVVARYRRTFAPYEGMDLYDAYQLQNIGNRNFRRIGYFANAAQIGLPCVSLFHDAEVARAYTDLPRELLDDERLHRRLCSLARPALAHIPANPWYVPMWLEPVLWRHVRTPARDVYRAARRLRFRAGRPAGAPAGLDEQAREAIAAAHDLGLIDKEAFTRGLSREPAGGSGNTLLFRLGALVALVRYMRRLPLSADEHTRLFPAVRRRRDLAVTAVA